MLVLCVLHLALRPKQTIMSNKEYFEYVLATKLSSNELQLIFWAYIQLRYSILLIFLYNLLKGRKVNLFNFKIDSSLFKTINQ